MTSNAGKTDIHLKMDVLAALRAQSSVSIADIGVLVKDGVVTLNGIAVSWEEKRNAVSATQRVAGVTAIADDIEVRLRGTGHHSDGEIAAEALNRIHGTTHIPPGAVRVTVRAGHITLTGEVEGEHQKQAAGSAVQLVEGHQGVSNQVTLHQKQAGSDSAETIEHSLTGSALPDHKGIRVDLSGPGVVLTGRVKSHAEWEEAERAAWAAPGVLSVDNQLKLEWS